MFRDTESNLKITINSDFCFKYEDNCCVKETNFKKCDYIALLTGKNKGKILSFIEVKRVDFFLNENKFDKGKAHNNIQEIIKKLLETYSFVKLFNLEEYKDQNLEKANSFLHKSKATRFILIVNDFKHPLRDRLFTIIECLRRQTKYLKVKTVVISQANPDLLSIKIEPSKE